MILIVQQALHDLETAGIRVITLNLENGDGTKDAAVVMRGLVWKETPNGDWLAERE